MQVPEKLSLIGGSILLASTLVFTLKSQASSIIPSVGHSISHVFDHIGDTQKNVDFDNNFKDAQKNGETTGNWGTSKYYVDKGMNLHVGKGNLQGSLDNALGDSKTNALKSINVDQPVVAPSDSTNLFAGTNGAFQSTNTNIQSINGMNNVDTSHVTNMSGMLAHNAKITNLDLSGWNTSQVNTLAQTFDFDNSLTNINVSNWDVSNVTDMGATFGDNYSLTDLNLSSWHNSKVNSIGYMFNQDFSLQGIDISNINMSNTNNNESSMFGKNYSLNKITINDTGDFSNTDMPANSWKNGDQIVGEIKAGHPGTWVNQYEGSPNLVNTSADDVRAANGWTDDGGAGFPVKVQKGKKYNISMLVDQNEGGGLYLYSNNNGIYSAGPNGFISSVAGMPPNPSRNYVLIHGNWTADRDGIIYVRFVTSGPGTAHWKHATVTQSDSYVPFNIAQNSKK